MWAHQHRGAATETRAAGVSIGLRPVGIDGTSVPPQGVRAGDHDRPAEWTDEQGIEVIELHATPTGRELYRELGFFVKTDNISMMALRADAAREVPEA